MSTKATSVIPIQNLPSEMIAQFNAQRAYIVNITETEFLLSRTYGNYRIAAKQPGEAYAVTEIQPRKGVSDYGDNRVIEWPIYPGEVAHDIVREINSDAGPGDICFLGVFVSAGKQPTEAELADAYERLRAFDQWCVAEGDKTWQRYHLISFVPDVLKRAVARLKLDREWASKIQPNFECPACGILYKPGIAVCANCRAVLNREKAMQFFPERFALGKSEETAAAPSDEPSKAKPRKS